MALRVEAATELAEIELKVGFEVAAGECLALAGPSGAGKTTILKIVAGLMAPRRGAVSCDEDVWLDTAAGVSLPPERRSCGFLFQDYALFPHLTLLANVAYPMRGLRREERRRRAGELLERFGLQARAQARPATLSGGERQRAALARALAVEPAVLLLDEPLSALDARTRGAATRELATVLREAGAAAVLVTHDFAEAARLGDRVGVIDAGRVVQTGTASQLAAEPASAFVADFTGAAVLTGVASPGPEGLTRVDLDGGGSVLSTEPASGPVGASLYPWEVEIQPADAAEDGSARNRLAAEILTVTEIGNRVRVGLALPQPLAAELTLASARRLGLRPGSRVTAAWKASATRLVSL